MPYYRAELRHGGTTTMLDVEGPDEPTVRTNIQAQAPDVEILSLEELPEGWQGPLEYEDESPSPPKDGGYVFVVGPCYSCKQVFSFAPTKVPSIRVNGVKEPICRSCVERANPARRAAGLPPIVPLPGAYEPESEGNLP